MNEYVQNKVQTPGLVLAVAGGLSILAGLLNLAGGAWTVFTLMQYDMMTALTGAAQYLVLGLLTIGGGAFTAYAGMQLRDVGSAGIVYAGSIIAMLPCCSCCCIGLPAGIWAIMTMQDDQVKAAFDAEA